MSVNPNASIEITALKWAPEFAHGLVRDLRVRWALEEAGLDYRVRLLGSPRPAEYVQEQPFDQVPCFRDDQVTIFESGAIVQYVGEKSEALLPRETQARYRAIQWTYAALNSVEPAILNVFAVTVAHADQDWAKLRRPGAEEFARLKLKRVSDWLGEKQWLEGDRFTIGDLILVTVLRFLDHTNMVAEFPNLAAYQKRGESRPAFQRALSDQLAVFAANQPQAEPEKAAA
jgi:glutathione S-transferase